MYRRLALFALVLLPLPLQAQIVVVQRNVYLYPEPSTESDRLRRLEPPEVAALLDTAKTGGYYRVRTKEGLEGWVWGARVDVDLTRGVNDEPPTEYDRSEWKQWTDEDHDCQDTRQEVLIRDSSEPVTFESDRHCRVAEGTWIDPYSGDTLTDPGALDIDHMVPLKNAFKSGGWRWDFDKRERYANDLEDRHHLLAVKLGLNRSKGSKGPEEWMPPDTAYWCTYVEDWAQIKERWQLTMTTAELAKVDSVEATCQ